MDRIFELGRLLDIYGDLLTDRQREVVDLYANENYSLAEIAEHAGVSRQAVRDLLVRAEGILRDYELKLKISEKQFQQKAILASMGRRFHDVEMLPPDRDAFDGYLLTLNEIWED